MQKSDLAPGPRHASHYDGALTPTESARHAAQLVDLATNISVRLRSCCSSLSADELKELATGMAVIELKYLQATGMSPIRRIGPNGGNR